MELKPGYKQTEAGLIPTDWQSRPMLSAVRVANGQVDPRLEPFKSMILVAPDHIESGTGRLLKKETASDQRAISGKYSFASGDIIYSKIRPYLRKAILADFQGLCSADMYPLRPVPDVAGEYVFSVVLGNHFSRYAESVSVRSGMPKINRAELAEYFMALPPTKSEQEAIAEALSDADALIESLEQLLVKKRQIKQGAMQELLTGKKRLPGFTKEWEIKPVAEIAPLQRGFDLPTRQIHQGPYPVVYSNGILAHHTKYQAKAPGVVTGRSGTIGKVTFVSEDYWPHNTSLWVTDFKGNDPRLIFYLFILMDLERFSTGSGVPTLNRNDVHAYRINIPQDAEEQSAIANVLSDMDAEIAAFEAKLAKARQIKQGMMQELLTGRIRLVRPSAQILSIPARESASAIDISHNTYFNEAVVIAVLSARFGSEAFPLGRFRRTKFSYLLHRHVEHEAAGFMKKAAGPYNPRTRYGGAEKIALQNRYVRVLSTGKSEGFVADENIAQAEGYFDKWYGAEALTWLEQFRYQKNDSLELLTTVDMACEELSRAGKAATLSAVKQIIHDSPEWTAKLNRSVFSDDNIKITIKSCDQLFPLEKE